MKLATGDLGEAPRSACSLLPLWYPDDETHKYSAPAFLIFADTKAVALSEANLQELPPTTRYRTKAPSAQELKSSEQHSHPRKR